MSITYSEKILSGDNKHIELWAKRSELVENNTITMELVVEAEQSFFYRFSEKQFKEFKDFVLDKNIEEYKQLFYVIGASI